MQVSYLISKTNYDLTHFTMKSYADGGLSYKQFTALLEALSYREANENKFLAALHGIKLKGDTGTSEVTHSAAVDIKNIDTDSLTDEERKELTDKMIADEMAGFNQFMASMKKV